MRRGSRPKCEATVVLRRDSGLQRDARGALRGAVGTVVGMRAYDIRRGIDLLTSRPDVDTTAIRAVARGEAGVWLLLAAAADTRIQRIWLDRTPYSLRAALDEPLNRNLHAAIIPGFCLRWDLANLVTAMQGRAVLWTDPTNWMGVVVPVEGDYRYRGFSVGDAPYLEELMR